MKRPANDAGVVGSADYQQPPLICLLDAAQICPLLRKAGNYRMLSKFVIFPFNASKNLLFLQRNIRRGARAVESGGLENRCGLTATVGSNPTLSAKFSFTF